MTLPAGLPVVDHHCHLSPAGEGVDAARRFYREGGSHLFLTTHNWDRSPLLTAADYGRQFETMEALGHRIQTAGVGRVSLVLAPYPVDLLPLAESIGLDSAVDVQIEALDLAGARIREHRAVALGEVGWPHFPVSKEIGEAARRVFRHALEVAHDVECPVVVHCEDLDADGYRDLSMQAKAAGVAPETVVKHYVRTYVPPEGRFGITPSFLAKKDAVTAALHDPGPWFLETDFLDDPRRPGAVLDIATVPRRAAAVDREQPELAGRLRIPFVESVQAVYGFTPERPKDPPP